MLLSVQQAQEKILSTLSAMPKAKVKIQDALGFVLAGDITSKEEFPPFTNSSMDGFAVLGADIASASQENPVQLAVVADIPAGSVPTSSVQTGQAARIMTGAPLPDGADTVVPLETTDARPDAPSQPAPAVVQVYQSYQPGSFVRPNGQDITAGQKVIPAGRRLQPQDIGLLAMLGETEIMVHRRPQIAIFSTGDELVTPDQPLTPGKIRNSNSYFLTALAQKYGAQVISLPIARDHPDEVRDRLDQAVHSGADLILTSAGVSVGAYDFVRSVIEENGGLNLWRVNMRPGKPLAYGEYRRVPVMCLPGNPVSAFVTFLVFVVPVIHKMAGLDDKPHPWESAVLAEPIDSDGRESYLRAIVSIEDGVKTCRLTGHQGSGNLLSLVQANALLIVPSGVKSLPAGSLINIWVFNETGG